MPKPTVSEREFKRVLKEALAETLQDQRELLHDVMAEVLEEFALAQAIREGRTSKRATRAEVFRLLPDAP